MSKKPALQRNTTHFDGLGTLNTKSRKARCMGNGANSFKPKKKRGRRKGRR